MIARLSMPHLTCRTIVHGTYEEHHHRHHENAWRETSAARHRPWVNMEHRRWEGVIAGGRLENGRGVGKSNRICITDTLTPHVTDAPVHPSVSGVTLVAAFADTPTSSLQTVCKRGLSDALLASSIHFTIIGRGSGGPFGAGDPNSPIRYPEIRKRCSYC